MVLLKVIIDLMEAYSEHVGLPLLLVNLDGEIDYKISGDKLEDFDLNPNLFSKLKNTSLKQKNPTILSISDESYSANLFYIVTPTFKFKNRHFFIAAGPCLLEAENISESQLRIKVLNDYEIEERLGKIRNLYSLLGNKEVIETKLVLPEQIIQILQKVGNIDCDKLDDDYYVFYSLDELLNIDGIDFIGIAKKNAVDIFVVQHVNGENVLHLDGKKFYLGEGLLGDAAILEKDFNWEKGISNSRRPEFFHRYGIFPEHLFGLSMTKDIIIFGGNFQEKSIDDNTLKIIKFIINYLFQKKQIKTKVMDAEHLQSVNINLMELIYMIINLKDRKYLSYKLLDFFQVLNKNHFACFTTVYDEFIFRGKMKNEIYQLHRNIINLDPDDSRLFIEQHCIHVSIKHYGTFTIEFEDKMDLQFASYLLEMICNIMNMEEILFHKNESQHENSVFQILYTSMKEMNPHQYDLSQHSLRFAKNLVEQLNIPNHRSEMIYNVCKVLPYNIQYLEQHILHTEEWKILCNANSLLQHSGNIHPEFYTMESQIVAFIYKVIIQKESLANIDFLSSELMELFEKEYHALFSIDDMDEEQIEEITDLRSVISTLTLTRREKEILYLILEGLNNHEVGQYLKISVHTVKNHVTNIFKKLNVSDRFQAMAKIYRIKYGE